jgi:hypothetical protein
VQDQNSVLNRLILSRAVAGSHVAEIVYDLAEKDVDDGVESVDKLVELTGYVCARTMSETIDCHSTLIDITNIEIEP